MGTSRIYPTTTSNEAHVEQHQQWGHHEYAKQQAQQQQQQEAECKVCPLATDSQVRGDIPSPLFPRISNTANIFAARVVDTCGVIIGLVVAGGGAHILFTCSEQQVTCPRLTSFVFT